VSSATVEEVQETLAIPFTLPERTAEGRFRREEQPMVHFGMIDSGAMVSCVPLSVVKAFPRFAAAYQPCADMLTGIG
jgi:hypothetical protein